eukprot:m.91394 g.91394  ORF g.91394 m.91394 type:complete len:318 (+) comp51142_c1_seq1:48-1001(+)
MKKSRPEKRKRKAEDDEEAADDRFDLSDSRFAQDDRFQRLQAEQAETNDVEDAGESAGSEDQRDDDDDEAGDREFNHDLEGSVERDEEDALSEGENDDDVSASTSKQKPSQHGAKRGKRLTALSASEIEAYSAKVAKRGIIYFSSLPPFMKPEKVRFLMAQYGGIGKVYLKEEDASSRRRRLKKGGNKKKYYIEGWVEFEDKKVAKRVVASLNGQIVGGDRRNFHYNEIWSMKYLPKFKWHHLTERIAYERAVKEQRLNAEMNQVKKETSIYLDRVARSKSTEKVFKAKAERLEKKGLAAKERKIRNIVHQRDAILE